MKRHKRNAARLLMVVFAAILLASFSHFQRQSEQKGAELTVVHAHEFSGEAPGNISRTYIDNSGYESRIFQDFAFHTILEFHGALSHVSLAQTKNTVEQFKAPVKVYKQIRKFLI